MHRRRLPARAGFTLFETLLVLVIAGILLGIAWPPVARSYRRHEAQAAVRTLRTDLARARARAVLDAATVRVVLDTVSGSYRIVADGVTVGTRSLGPGLLLRTSAHRQEVLFSARGTSNLYSTTWIGVEGDPGARWHGLRVIPTGAIEAR